MPVPTTSTVQPGASVSIVLKADQRTGRQVSGIVQDLLTRGNHPRGIKVRLADGRIGRVQQMSGGSGGSGGGSETRSEVLRDLEIQERVRGPDRSTGATATASAAGGGAVTADGGGASAGARGYVSERLNSRYTDMRADEAAEQPPEQLDLMAFVKPAKQKKRGSKASKAGVAGDLGAGGEHAARATGTETKTETGTPSALVSTCPVCGVFEGDEAAVAHHVEGHFD